MQQKLGIQWHKVKIYIYEFRQRNPYLYSIAYSIMIVFISLWLKNTFSDQFKLVLSIYKSFLKSKVTCNVDQKKGIIFVQQNKYKH